MTARDSLEACSHLRQVERHGLAEEEGILVLGTPVGGDQFVSGFLDNAVIKVESFCKKVFALHARQTGVSMLRLCAGFCRVVHLIRVLDPEKLGNFPLRVDNVMINSFQRVTGVALSSEMMCQLHLPLCMGGFGIFSVQLLAGSLYVAAMVRYSTEGQDSIGVPNAIFSVSLNVAHVLERLGNEYPKLRQFVNVLVPRFSCRENVLQLSDHRRWSEIIYDHHFQLMVNSASVRNKARLLCLKNPLSGAWLAACPAPALGLQLTNAEFNVLVRWRLGCEIGEECGVCSICGSAANSFGDHLVCCQRNGVIRRHNAIVHYLSKVASASGLPHRLECSVDGESRERPGDIMMLRWEGGGMYMVDVCVSHPLALSNVWSSVRTGRECLEAAEAGKRRKYSGLIQNIDKSYTVFAVSSFGQLSVGAESFLNEMMSCYSTDESSVEEAELNKVKIVQQLQIVIHRELARMLLVGYRSVVRVDPLEGDPLYS